MIKNDLLTNSHPDLSPSDAVRINEMTDRLQALLGQEKKSYSQIYALQESIRFDRYLSQIKQIDPSPTVYSILGFVRRETVSLALKDNRVVLTSLDTDSHRKLSGETVEEVVDQFLAGTKTEP